MNLVPENINEAIKHLKGVSPEEMLKKQPELIDDFYDYLNLHFPYDHVSFSPAHLEQLSKDFYLSPKLIHQCIKRYFEARIKSKRHEDMNEAYDFHKTHFQIYKNNDTSDFYNYIVLKGNDLYNARLVAGEKMQWRYVTEIDKNKYNINGTLVTKPPMKLIVIFQNQLKKL